MTKKLYVSRHVTFLEKLPHYPFFSTPAPITKDKLVYIDPFLPDVPPDKFIFDLEVSDLPPVNSLAPSPAALLVYKHCKAPPRSPFSDSVVSTSLSGSRSSCTLLSPLGTSFPVRFGFTNTCFYFFYHSFLSYLHTYYEPKSYKEAFHVGYCRE